MRAAASTRVPSRTTARAAASDRVALKRVTEETMALPTFPIVASRLIEEVARPDATSEEIARIVSLDPALTARTLKLANSDFYGFPRKVGSVDLAVLVLGPSTIRDLVLTSSVVQTLGRSGSALEGFRRRWRRTFLIRASGSWRSRPAAATQRFASDRISAPHLPTSPTSSTASTFWASLH